MLRTISVRRRRIDQAAAVSYRPRRYWLSLLALMAGPVASETTNAVVIDFGQGRLILGWIGLWLLTAVTFAACADRRLQLMSRLAEYLDARAARRQASRADAALRQLTRGDAQWLAELRVAYALAKPSIRLQPSRNTRVAPMPDPLPAPQRPVAATVRRAEQPRQSPVRGFRTVPLPGMPLHLQYLPC